MPAFWQSLLLSSHHIKSKNLYPASKDRPSLPLNTYLILPSCWSSHRSIEGSLTWSSLSICVCCSPSVGTFPCCWHKTWTQATFPPKRLSCLLHLIDYLFLWTLTCSYRQWGDLIQQCFVLFFFLSVILGNLIVGWQLDGYVFEDRGLNVASQDPNMMTPCAH